MTEETNTETTAEKIETVAETVTTDVKTEVEKIGEDVLEKFPSAKDQAKSEIDKLRSILVAFGHIAKDDLTHTDAEVLAFTSNLVVHMKKVLQNSGIMINHSITVLESYAQRMDGVLMDELKKGTDAFKGREGWKDLKAVFSDIEKLFIKADGTPPVVQAPPSEVSKTASDATTDTPTV